MIKRLAFPLLALFFVLAQYSLIGVPSPVAGSAILFICLVALSEHDMRHMKLPNALTAILATCGLLVVATQWPVLLRDHILAALFWGALLWVISEVWFRRTKRDVLGLGDVKLIAASALWLGPAVSQAVVLGSVAGLIYGTARGFWGSTTAFAFGPFICISVWIVWSWHGFGPLGIVG